MAIAYDANSTSSFQDDSTATSLSWTHTPSGAPGAIIVGVVAGVSALDIVTGITYGGETMTEVPASSPLLSSLGSENHSLHLYVLGLTGHTVPSGAQTVAVTLTATFSDRIAFCVSYTTGAVIEIVDHDVQESASTTDPGGSLSLGGNTCAVCEVGFSGQGAITSVAPLSGWGTDFAGEVDMGTAVGLFYTYNTIGSSDVTTGFTNSVADEASVLSVAFKEAAGGPSIPILSYHYNQMRK